MALVGAADAGLVAADAGADVVEPPVARLIGQLRVADHRPGHAAQIGLAGGQDALGDLRLVDAPGDQDRQAHRLLDGGAIGRQVAGLEAHGRRDVDRAAEARRGAGGDTQVVEPAVMVEESDGRQDLCLREAAVGQLVAGDPQTDGPRAHRRAHRFDHLPQEPQTAGEIAAVAVLAQIDPRIEELGRQIAVACHDLDAVEASRRQVLGGAAVAGDDVGQ